MQLQVLKHFWGGGGGAAWFYFTDGLPTARSKDYQLSSQ